MEKQSTVLEKLSDRDREIIFQCLNAIGKGNFLEDEFQTRLGIEPDELDSIVAAFPEVDDSRDDSVETLAINNCLNEVAHGISFSEKEWRQWFTVDKKEVSDVYNKWARLRGWKTTGII